MLTRLICSSGLLAALFTFSGIANATPIFYDEVASGDLNGSKSFTLDIGANTVIGTHQVTPNTDNYDAWSFELGSGLGISSISFNYEDPMGNYNEYPNQGSFGITAPGNNLLIHEVNMDGDYNYTESFTDPLTDVGSYFVELTGDFVYPSGSWTAVFNVISLDGNSVGVPEPASVSLLGLGLLALIYSRRRKYNDQTSLSF